MKTNTENSIRLAYSAPETTCLELSPMMESCVPAGSPFGVSTQKYGIQDENEDDWM